MLTLYLKIAYRNLIRHKAYTLINISGLATGVACCLLIFMYINDELSYDRFHDKAAQTFRITYHRQLADKNIDTAITPSPMAKVLVKEFPAVQSATRIIRGGNVLVHHGKVKQNEERFLFGDRNYFDVFSAEFIVGDRQTALVNPFSIVITASTARKYFQTDNALGKILKVENQHKYVVTGIIKDLPENAHFHLDFLASLSTLSLSTDPSWLNKNVYTYVVLKKDFKPAQMTGPFKKLNDKYIKPQYLKSQKISAGEFDLKMSSTRFSMQRLTDIHLYSNLEYEIEENSDIKYLYIFSSVGFVILLIACINFTNLSTARFTNRSKEVGLRKLFGSSRSELIKQFLIESNFLSLISFIISLPIIELFIPVLNFFTDKQLSLSSLFEINILLVIIVSIFLVGTVAGSYPAFFLSSLQPIDALKSRPILKNKSFRLRNGFVILTFSAAFFLLFCTTVIFNQLDYFHSKKLGFSKEQVVVFPRAYVLRNRLDGFKQKLLSNPNILSVAYTKDIPGDNLSINEYKSEASQHPQFFKFSSFGVGYDFLETFGLTIIKGRFFKKDRIQDNALPGLVINESTLKAYQWKNPIGKSLTVFNPDTAKRQQYRVIGIIKDFNFGSLKQKIKPLAIFLSTPAQYRYINIKINPEKLQETMVFLEQTWQDFVPDRPLEYFFLKDDLEKLYHDEHQTGQVFIVFSILAIFIACLGLFGLLSFSLEQRTKEIGIKKALGASSFVIMLELFKDVIKPVLIASAISWPIVYTVMYCWLQRFPYHISIGFLPFVIAALPTLLTATLAVSIQLIKAATRKPVFALRHQ